MRKYRSLDTLLSGALFAIFAGLSAYAYANILKAEAPSHVFMRAIVEGEKKFRIMHGASCIGEISTNLTRGENTFLHSVAEANASYGRMHTTARINALLQFNPLGQLLESSSEITAQDTHIVVKTKDINPIRFQISATLGARHFDFTLTAPGPALLKKAGADSYQVEYSQFRAGDGSLLKGVGSNLLSQADLTIAETGELETSCPPAQRTYLDVAALLLRANINADALQNFVPGLGR